MTVRGVSWRELTPSPFLFRLEVNRDRVKSDALWSFCMDGCNNKRQEKQHQGSPTDSIRALLLL